jgi:hypothetical protein
MSIFRFLYRFIVCKDRKAEPIGYIWATRHICDDANWFFPQSWTYSRKDWEEELEYQAQQDAYLDRIAEADYAYDSYVGDNHPAHDKQ